MQLVALQFKLIARNEVRPAFCPVVQRIADYSEVFIQFLGVGQQYAGLFEQFADRCAVQIQALRFNAETRIRVPATQTGAKIVDGRIIIINDSPWKCIGSTKRRLCMPAHHKQLGLGRSGPRNGNR